VVADGLADGSSDRKTAFFPDFTQPIQVGRRTASVAECRDSWRTPGSDGTGILAQLSTGGSLGVPHHGAGWQVISAGGRIGSTQPTWHPLPTSGSYTRSGRRIGETRRHDTFVLLGMKLEPPQSVWA
jgi:hypothetical protein